MLTSNKRKSRWGSKSFFGSKNASKVVIIERASSDNGNTDDAQHATAVEISLDGSSVDHPEKTGYRSRFRRSGSKVLSLLGLWKNSSMSILDFEVCLAYVRTQVVEPRLLRMNLASGTSLSQSPEMPLLHQKVQSVSIALYTATLFTYHPSISHLLSHCTQQTLLRYYSACLQTT